jgi:O-antigen ligase
MLSGTVAVTTLLALRADAIFYQQNGLPTPSSLFAAKFVSQPYDFHYYTLGNPNGTAAYLLIPFLCAIGLALSSRARRALVGNLAAATVLGATLVLAYTRSAVVVAVVAALTLVASSDVLRPRLRIVACAVFTLGTGAVFTLAFSSSYFTSIFSTASGASGGERLQSISDSIGIIGDHPFTGLGLGMYSALSGYLPAHSSVAQAAAESGVLAGLGLLALTVWGIVRWVRLRRGTGPRDARTIAAAAVAVYLVYCGFTGGASAASFSGYLAVWGLTAALMLGLAARGDDQPSDPADHVRGRRASIRLRRRADAT